ncbi:uncharacterized protein C1orf131 homolog [Antennarius striatus]|uniref:uncharacterized protein C1orf131 homolog n=1 Tax=Antennarius striatus TaxID=241820 RepID=UPI0035AD7A35
MNSETNREPDEDCQFLEHILDKLYDFGNGPASKKKLKSQKKKKRKRSVEDEEEEELCAVKDVSRGSEDRANQTGPEQTGPAIQLGSQVEVVTFHDPRKKLKTTQSSGPYDKVPAPQVIEKKNEALEELNLEKARLEVHRFGITGYKKEQQRVFEQDRAVMLGARPPKKEYVNYKILQQQIKDKKQKPKEEVQPDLKKKKKQNNQRDKKKVSSGSGDAPTGQVGRFKNGMLILNAKEIQKIKSSKRGK